jgi:hypothetical protein
MKQSIAQGKHTKQEHGRLGYWTIGRRVLAGGMKDVTFGSRILRRVTIIRTRTGRDRASGQEAAWRQMAER